jgi:cellulose synthase/poly-beta-1,6-N-acetylglucosamine synthase-like glycosyltransferase
VIIYGWVILTFFVAFVLVHSTLTVLAAVELRRYAARENSSALRRTLRSPLAPPIAVLVPAYNEEAGIADSVRSLLALDYPKLEVVVINDGSRDGTLQRLTEVFGLRPVRRPTPPFLPHKPVRGVYAPSSQLRLLVIDKENGGKADSLNAGINFSSFPIVCSVDADSILEQDALAKTALPFVEDPDLTVATGGMVRIANGCKVERGRVLRAALPRSRLAMFQVVEYLRAFFVSRTGWTALNGLLIVSGAFGLFRRDVLIAAGGYRTDNMGEDLELVVRLHRFCCERRRAYRIVYVADPVCWTEAPDTAHSLRLQRSRWHRACLETLLRHRRMFFNPRYRSAGMIAIPSMLVFEILGPLIELSGYLVTVIAVLLGILSVENFVLLFALAILYGMVLTLGAAALEDATANRHPAWSELRRVLLFTLGESLGYRQLLHVWRIEGFWQLYRKAGWGAMERKGLSGPAAAPGGTAPGSTAPGGSAAGGATAGTGGAVQGSGAQAGGAAVPEGQGSSFSPAGKP